MMQSFPSHVLGIVVSNRVVLLLEGIDKSCPSGLWPKNCRLISDIFLTVSFPSISNTGKGFEEREGDFFTVGNFLDREITLY
jgi:hypothetical protein